MVVEVPQNFEAKNSTSKKFFKREHIRMHHGKKAKKL